MFYTSDSIEPR